VFDVEVSEVGAAYDTVTVRPCPITDDTSRLTVEPDTLTELTGNVVPPALTVNALVRAVVDDSASSYVRAIVVPALSRVAVEIAGRTVSAGVIAVELGDSGETASML
jgi:hypothetical protein